MTPPDGDTTRRWADREPHTPYEARGGLTYSKVLGYVPADKTAESASRTLEDATTIGAWRRLRSAGQDGGLWFFLKRSLNYAQPVQSADGIHAGEEFRRLVGWRRRMAGPRATSGFTPGR